MPQGLLGIAPRITAGLSTPVRPSTPVATKRILGDSQRWMSVDRDVSPISSPMNGRMPIEVISM
jgi:hypothetical protein